jgi:hypothetical protein
MVRVRVSFSSVIPVTGSGSGTGSGMYGGVLKPLFSCSVLLIQPIKHKIISTAMSTGKIVK